MDCNVSCEGRQSQENLQCLGNSEPRRIYRRIYQCPIGEYTIKKLTIEDSVHVFSVVARVISQVAQNLANGEDAAALDELWPEVFADMLGCVDTNAVNRIERCQVLDPRVVCLRGSC